ncbi:MAG TPA: CCA tRNA nucleotidyltransferase [Bacteroidales bacterium]|nr:CCA tRNA nucleotidyltransferase [Bacteroidales bacterium]HRR53448.1 CCA tRNA nucleotidyltransferase [Bacteroidales bacterium]
MRKDIELLLKKIRMAVAETPFEGNIFIAGGFVRDMIIHRPSKDIDIVVANNGLNGGIKFAEFLHEKLNSTNPVIFERFGTAQIVVEGIEIETVATRKESYNFIDRKPEVIDGTIEDDVRRRDFTVNSLLWDICNEKVIDLLNGIDDINNKIIRTTSNPELIFSEDPLRIMRAIRFASQLGFDIETETFTAIKNSVNWLNNISLERIRDEFSKILISDNVSKGLELLKESGILAFLEPAFNDIQNNWGSILDVVNKSKSNIEHRLTALFHDMDEVVAKNFMKKFKFTNAQIELVNIVIVGQRLFDNNLNFDPKQIRKFANSFGKDKLLFLMDLVFAKNVNIEAVENLKDFIERDKIVNNNITLPFTGKDIMSRFNLKSGLKIGELINLVKDKLFENPDLSEEDMWNLIEQAL